MEGFSEKVKQAVMYISFQERKKRDLIRYRQEKQRILGMEDDEIDMEYINLKSEYEHKKNVLLVFFTSIVISILMSAWNIFYEYTGKIVQYIAITRDIEIKIAEVTFYLNVTFIIFITIIVFWMLAAYLKRIKQLYKKMLMIEEIKKECMSHAKER